VIEVQFVKASESSSLKYLQKVHREDGPPLTVGEQLCGGEQPKALLAVFILLDYRLYVWDLHNCHPRVAVNQQSELFALPKRIYPRSRADDCDVANAIHDIRVCDDIRPGSKHP